MEGIPTRDREFQLEGGYSSKRDGFKLEGGASN